MLITTSSSDIDASLPSRFLVLEIVEGDTLADRLSTNSPDYRDPLVIGTTVEWDL